MCSTFIPASPEEVFDVLLDPYAYPRWVVGARKVRSVQPEWPQVGSSFHHESGPWPLLHRDRTTLVDVARPGLVELHAHARPTGIARVRISVEPEDEGARVTIEEAPIGGIVKPLWNPLFEALLRARNSESLRRLRHLVAERRSAA